MASFRGRQRLRVLLAIKQVDKTMMEQKIRQVSQGGLDSSVSDEQDLWLTLHTRLTDKSSPSLNFRRATFRVGWVICALATLFLAVTIAYAATPALQSLLNRDSGLKEVSSTGLGHSLQLSQVANDVIVNLNWVYADENRIAIAYTIHARSGEQYEPSDFKLTDTADNNFLPTTGLGLTGPAEDAGVALPLGEGEYIFSFDATSITNRPKMPGLQLELWLKSQVDGEIIGPFTFTFDAPFTPGRMMETNQSHTAEGVTITLEKVLLSPSDFTAVICFEGPDDSYKMWLPISHIDVKNGEEEIRATVGSQSNPDEAGCTTNHYFPSLYDYEGVWSLTLTELVGVNMGYTETGEPQADQRRIPGNWVFEFALP